MTGGLGIDNFVFTTALGAANIDIITDFTVADDTMRLDGTVFSTLTAGTLNAAAFTIGAAASNATHRIVYDSATGAVYYDADGSGAGLAKQYATVSTGLAMTNADFFVF